MTGSDRAPARERRGLALAATALAALALIVAGLVLALYNERQAHAQQLRVVGVQAQVVAGSVAAPLAFGDEATTNEYLNALKADPDVEAAAVYDLQGKLFAGWVRGGAPLPPRRTARGAASPGDRLEVTQPVSQGGTQLGAVYLRALEEPWPRRTLRYGGIGLLVLMAALLVAGLGAGNVSLARAHRKLRGEMAERAKAEEALRQSQRQEALAQLEIATERGRAALQQSEAELEFALRAGSLGSWTRDLRSGHFAASELFRAQFGFGADETPQRGDFVSRIHVEDRAEQLQRVDDAIARRSLLEAEFRTLTPAGRLRWLMLRGRADYDAAGAPLRIAGVSMDITARKAADERQRLLLDELNHRVKNTLASVQSIALQTGRASSTASEFEGAFVSRINALARVHDLLTAVAWEGASLADVVGQTLSPYRARSQPDRISWIGPEVRLGPNAAVTFAMAFHELATNAAKYGALSAPGGRVEVEWRNDASGDPPALEIVWRESGGPPVSPPAHRGFGGQFLERALAREFDGSVHLRFTSTGLVCGMRLPLSAKLRLAA
ncbi:MAG TPA: HWE histidine kinase domain-containing protein [Caulobacteraceae bacterium]|nr:HWE histidine kinase domain-containing protein [Caulobacteraceae bacterium]